LRRGKVQVAPLPELQPPAESVPFCLENDQIRLHGLPAGVCLRHPGQALVRCGDGPLLEGQELGVNLDPVAGFFRVGSLGVLAFEKPIRIDRG